MVAVTQSHSRISGRRARAMALDAKDINRNLLTGLHKMGIYIQPDAHIPGMAGVGLDAAPNNVGPVPAPINLQSVETLGAGLQFLQKWLPGHVQKITWPRTIDTLIGINTVGDWEDEEIIQSKMELTGQVAPYGDFSAIPMASFNLSYEKRSIVRMMLGFTVGKLEERRMAKGNVNTAAMKRLAVTDNLEIDRNRIGFYGYNNGNNRTYGFFNDPDLPAIITAEVGTSGSSQWKNKTFQEIIRDFRQIFSGIRTQSMGNVDPKADPITMAMGNSIADYLNVTTDQGISVQDWLGKNYPNTRIVLVPECDSAFVADESVIVAFPETINDGLSDDGGSVFDQLVPVRYMSLGTSTDMTNFTEAATNATAGVLLKRPYAVYTLGGL